MSATARALTPEPVDPSSVTAEEALAAQELQAQEDAHLEELASHSTEYATRGARKHRTIKPNLRMVAPLRAEKASRGMFAIIVGGLLMVGMVVILVINTTIAQSAFTVSELQAQQASLAQQEQQLSRQIADAAAPDALVQKARAMGMVPSENPVFLNPDGSIVGSPKPARGATSTAPTLKTPADLTAGEGVDSGSAGLPNSLPADYDPATADAAQLQARDFNQPRSTGPKVSAAQRAASTPVTLGATDLTAAPVDAAATAGEAGATDATTATTSTTSTKAGTTAKAAGKGAKPKPGQWSDTIDVSGLSADSLSAVPVP